MTKLPTEPRAYDLVCTTDLIYYRINLNQEKGRHYAYFKNDLVRNVEVTEEEYNQAKYRGPAAPYYIGEQVVYLSDGQTLRSSCQSQFVRRFDSDGTMLGTLPESIMAFCGLYGIALDADGHLWTADPCFHQVAQYELSSGRQLFALGGNDNWDPGEFDHPEDIAIYGEHAFISDMGHYRVVLLNTRTKQWGTYRTFGQPVWQYCRLQAQEVVLLDDGIYLL